MSNILDSDQARRLVGPDLDPNCLQRLSADDKSCRSLFQVLNLNLHLFLYSSVRFDETSRRRRWSFSRYSTKFDKLLIDLQAFIQFHCIDFNSLTV